VLKSLGTLAFGGVFIACLVIFAAMGHEPPSTPAAGVAAVVFLLINAGGLAGAYLLSAAGLGRVVLGITIRRTGTAASDAARGSLALQLAAGLAAQLWLSHLLGLLGVLSGAGGQVAGWIALAPGIVLILDQIVRGDLHPETWRPLSRWAVLAAPGLALLIVAASSPPGSLWLGAASEGGGYDVLSYHLELPREWATAAADGGAGRLQPVAHNVYSYLPGYMEAAYLHVAALVGGGRRDGGSFVDGSGIGVIACAYLHAMLAVIVAACIARTVREGVTASASTGGPRTGDGAISEGAVSAAGCIAGAAAVSVPWVLVTGSLAYNELAVLATFAGAVLACLTPGLRPWARGALVGFLIGAACSAKPTSMFFCTPTAGLLLLFAARRTRREMLPMLAAGALAGGVAIAPWLIRNALASGNPVFPFAHTLFGGSHWSAEQFNRYAAAHTFDGGTPERLSRLFSRGWGMLHEQWSILFPVAAVAGIGAIAWRRTRRLAVLLAVGLLLQLAAWMELTHLQSRFLLPAVVPLCLAIGLGGAALMSWVERLTAGTSLPTAPLARGVVGLAPLSLAAWAGVIFFSQRGGRPNVLLAAGPEAMTGQAYAAEMAQMHPQAALDLLRHEASPPMFVNLGLPPGSAVYMLGGATPLYYLPGDGLAALWYNTTWDDSPLARAVRANPDDPAAWSAAVRGAMQARFDAAGRAMTDVFVLADLGEVARLFPTDPGKQVWFDPALTPAVIRRWLAQECERVQSWNAEGDRGVVLVRLKGTR